MQEGGRILARIMRELEKKVKPGITTKYLDEVAEDLVFKYNARPSFKGFNKYPATLCVSINEEIVHAVPSDRKIKQGDILSLDLGIKYKGYCTDIALTIPIGKVDRRIKKLINITKEALEIGIKQAKPRNHLEDIGWAIKNYVEKQAYSARGANGPIRGFNVIRELVGHGVGKKVHEDPQIPNFGEPGKGIKLKQGMVLALEPMVSMGNWRVKKSEDGFGYKTKDKSLSAHFEHTIAITKSGPRNLTEV